MCINRFIPMTVYQPYLFKCIFNSPIMYCIDAIVGFNDLKWLLRNI